MNVYVYVELRLSVYDINHLDNDEHCICIKMDHFYPNNRILLSF